MRPSRFHKPFATAMPMLVNRARFEQLVGVDEAALLQANSSGIGGKRRPAVFASF